jgi:predicted RNase H-like nuclease (RuvC/YqgF family)
MLIPLGIINGDGKMPDVLNTLNEIKAKINEINNILNDTKIATVCEILDILGEGLRAILERNKTKFHLQMDYNERSLNIYVRDIYIASIDVEETTTLKEIYEKLFSSDEIRQRIVEKIYDKIAELATILSWRADVIRELRNVEREIEELERRLDP